MAAGLLLQALGVVVGVVVTLAVWEQFEMARKRKHLKGSSFVYPFVGNIVEMVMNPFPFYDKLAKSGSVAWTGIIGK